MKRRYDTPESLYRSAPLPRVPRTTRVERKRQLATEKRIAYRLSPAATTDAIAQLAADHAEGRARRRILYELTSHVPDFHRLTDEQRAILVAVKRDAELGRTAPLDWILLMTRFDQLKPQPTQKQMDNARRALQARGVGAAVSACASGRLARSFRGRKVEAVL